MMTDAQVLAHTRSIPFIGNRIPRGWKHIFKACELPGFEASHCLVPFHDDGKFGALCWSKSTPAASGRPASQP